MKLQKVVIENFRGYKEKTEIEFSNLTAFVGKNDIGKSTVMEALDVFFHDGKGIVKLDKGDINVENNRAGNLDIIITGIFTDLPEKVIIDESYETTLENEYLVNKDNKFEIIKKFKNGSTLATSLKTEIKAFHPSNPKCNNLLQKKNADLKKIVDELNLECDKTINSSMRRAIWEYYKDSLELKELTIDVSSKEGDIKAIWTKLQTYLPSFSLFQSDRKNNDTDDEVQDPLKEAVKAIFLTTDIQGTLQKVAIQVKEKIQEVTDLTLEKIKDVSPEIASSLHPNIPDVESLKWYDVFKNLSISGDEIQELLLAFVKHSEAYDVSNAILKYETMSASKKKVTELISEQIATNPIDNWVEKFESGKLKSNLINNFVILFRLLQTELFLLTEFNKKIQLLEKEQ